jgi:hypothetical protein
LGAAALGRKQHSQEKERAANRKCLHKGRVAQRLDWCGRIGTSGARNPIK